MLALLPWRRLWLYLAHRFDWDRRAVSASATLCHGRSLTDGRRTLGLQKALFVTYWLFFRNFRSLRLRRSMCELDVWSRSFFRSTRSVFWRCPLSSGSARLPNMCMRSSCQRAVYLVSGLLRVRIDFSPSTFDQDSGALARIGGGSYEGPVTLFFRAAAAAILSSAPRVKDQRRPADRKARFCFLGSSFWAKLFGRLAGAAFAGFGH